MNVERRRPADLFKGLPPYPGGKRRLARLILALVGGALPQPEWAKTTLVDPFMGAGAVSVAAKAAGFQVRAGDFAERSAFIGRALVANSAVRLPPRAALRLLSAPAGSEDRGVEPAILDRLQPGRREFFRNAWYWLHSESLVGVERDLLMCLVMKLLLRSFPLSLPGATDAQHAAQGAYDRVSAARTAHYLRHGAVTPAEILRACEAVNTSVFAGHATFAVADAFETLAADARVAILDPPYPGTQRYERAFALLDEFIGSEPLPSSPFSGGAPPIDDLLAACAHIPVLVLCAGNARKTELEWMELVERHRTVIRSVSVPYRHYGAVASARKNADNRELLILSTTEAAS